MTYVTASYDWHRRELVDRTDRSIGRVEAVFTDQQSGEPTWALTRRGRISGRGSIVPLRDARPRGERVSLDIPRERVRGAPRLVHKNLIDDELEAALRKHYGLLA